MDTFIKILTFFGVLFFVFKFTSFLEGRGDAVERAKGIPHSKPKILPDGNSNRIDLNRVRVSQTEDVLREKFLSSEEVASAEVLRIIERYRRELVSKYKQLVSEDAYGNVSFGKWFDEVDYFIENVIYRDFAEARTCFDFDKLQSIVSKNIIQFVYSDENPIPLDVFNLSPIEFEEYCKDLLESLGWSARLTKASGDQGVDIIAEKNNFCLAVQCKKYSSPVGNAAVQEVVAGRIHYNADAGVVVSNAMYTASAKELARSTGIILLHHTDLAELDSLLVS